MQFSNSVKAGSAMGLTGLPILSNLLHSWCYPRRHDPQDLAMEQLIAGTAHEARDFAWLSCSVCSNQASLGSRERSL
jgi:hypothetical protein